jgi:hypothetical protein
MLERAIPPHARLLQVRKHVARTIQELVNLLDDIDGDPDLEMNGDEDDDPGDLNDGNGSEDDFMNHHRVDGGAGCPVSDPGGEHDGRELEHG